MSAMRQKQTFALSEHQLCDAVRAATWVQGDLAIVCPATLSAYALRWAPSSRRCARLAGTRHGASCRPGPDRPRIWALQCRRRTGRQGRVLVRADAARLNRPERSRPVFPILLDTTAFTASLPRMTS